MGSLQAQEMAGMNIPLETKLGWHLQHNHYPPLPRALIEVAVTAITLVVEADGDDAVWDKKIFLPDGLTFRDQPTVTVRDAVESLHLDAFLPQEEW